jgi:hypothetical protein
MPRDALTLSDVRASALEIGCEPCGRHGRYNVERLIAVHGRDAKLTELLVTLANCEKAHSFSIAVGRVTSALSGDPRRPQGRDKTRLDSVATLAPVLPCVDRTIVKRTGGAKTQAPRPAHGLFRVILG